MWAYLLLTTLTALGGLEVEVETLDGRLVVGQFLELKSDSLVVETPDGPITWQTDQLTALRPVDLAADLDLPSDVIIELTDGSRVCAVDYTSLGGTVRITLSDGPIIEIERRDVVAVRLQAETQALAAEWMQIRESSHDSDLLIVRKDNVIDYHRGVLHDVTDAVIQFELDGDLLPVKREKVQGLIYYRSGSPDFPKPLCRIEEANGSAWMAQSIAMKEGALTWKTLGGIDVLRPFASVTRVDFSHGKLVYLSDLEPESVDWTPYFGLGKGRTLDSMAQLFRPRGDQTLDGRRLSIDGIEYPKGLALHSRTEVVYRLPGLFQRFQATAGIDDHVRPRGNVRLLIRGDDRILLEETLRGTDPALAIDLDLTGVRRLVILADFGDDIDVADHLDLCEARILQ